ncbi:hypothetical protein MRX96_034742 [Rhipicephalus microplus]
MSVVKRIAAVIGILAARLMPSCCGDLTRSRHCRPSAGRAPAARTRGEGRSILRLRRGEEAPPGGAASGQQ